MSFWKKESKTVFERDEAGKVITVQRFGDQPKTPVSKALMEQYYEKHPEQRPSAKAKKRIVGAVKAVDDYSLKYAKSHRGARRLPAMNKPLPPLGSYSFTGNYNPFGDTFDKGRPKPKKYPQSRKKMYIEKGIAYPIAGASKKKKKTKSKRRKYDPNNPFSFPGMR